MSWTEKQLERLRAEFVMLAREPDTCMKKACNEFGISRKTGYKWLRRYEEHGLSGLVSRSCRPRNNPLQLSGAVVVSLVNIHEEHPGWGPKKLRARLSRSGHHPEELPCISTVARLSRRLGWTEAKGRGRQRRAVPAGPLSGAEAPNEVWTADFKGWWRTKDGRQCEPLTVRDLFSRYLLCVRPMERRSVTAVQQAFLEAFEQYGLPKTIRTDNGAPFAAINGPHGLTRLSAWWRTLGIKLERIAPGHPEQNGGHERMHGDMARELERRPAANLAEETKRLEDWRKTFNVERPHEALGMRVPGDVYRRSGRNLKDVVPYSYPSGYERRHVRRDGCIKLRNKDVYLSAALGKTYVGLESLAENTWRVWFCDLPIGTVKPIHGRLICQSEE